MSDKPQTTRRAIRGVADAGDAQLVLVDLPGVQRPRDALTERMQRRVEHEFADSDAALMVVNAYEGIGPGRPLDRRRRWRGAQLPVVLAVNELDRLDRAADRRGARRGRRARTSPTTSSRSRRGTARGSRRCSSTSRAHAGEPVPVRRRRQLRPVRGVLLAELVREQVLRRTFQEVPHTVEVVIDEIDRSREDLARVRALIWVETESQNRI